MHEFDDVLLNAALSQMNDSPPGGAYTRGYLERAALRHLFGDAGLAYANKLLAKRRTS